ncbi:unnamed protein product [Rotaria socialis]
MTTSSTAWIEAYLDNITNNSDLLSLVSDNDAPVIPSSWIFFLMKWALRLSCISIFIVCPWANYQLIVLFRTRRYHKESSAKWYVIFKAIFDIGYMLVSVPIIFCLTFDIDVIHRNFLTCKLITYSHYLFDDLISMMLALLCIDRMMRITCSCRFRQRFALTVCIVTVAFFAIINIHHIIRLQHRNGFCHKLYLSIWDYDFDIYYSLIYTSITWAIIFIASINLTVSVYCDRERRLKLLKQQKQQRQQQKYLSKILLNTTDSIPFDNDRAELIDNTDDIEDAAVVTIEANPFANESSEQEQQDNIDLQITVCVLIVSAIFLGCNLPNFFIFIWRYIYNSSFSTIGYIFVYMSIIPLIVAYTVNYFIFNHLAAYLFRNSSS